MMKLFRYLFLVKEIKSKTGVLHFQRWRILNLGFFAIYIHKIYEKDHDKHLHNHPWNYFNIILSGGYEEASQFYNEVKYSNMLPMRYSIRNHRTYHKINRIFKPTTTLFITGKRKFDWGYNVEGEFIENTVYRKNKHKGFYE